SAVLKHLAIIDVITISIGFVLRATAGVAAINGVLAPESTIELSYWLLVCTFSLCLFMGFAKRMAERAALGETAGLHRRVAPFYTTQRLDHMLSVSAALAMITYILYCVSPRTMDEISHSANMIYTIPFVLYGMFRFYALTLDGSVRGPVEIILGDKGIWAALAGWVAASVIIILHSKGLLVW
ncbi:MAG: decaprenyl-phosphate phosphoribosyltransferase, partial [Phycisphaerae bacterium]|nr:decaprenyl-phosphate phosphoribosyltransferase [Phycisphaerae bacterium]